MRRMAVLLLTLAIVIPARADDLDRLRTMLARSDFEGILHEPMPATAEGRAIRVWALYGSLAATGRGHLTDVGLREAFGVRPFEIAWLTMRTVRSERDSWAATPPAPPAKLALRMPCGMFVCNKATRGPSANFAQPRCKPP